MNKHVESTLVPRLDEGSNPSSSTPLVSRKPQSLNRFCGFFLLWPLLIECFDSEKIALEPYVFELYILGDWSEWADRSKFCCYSWMKVRVVPAGR